MIGNQEWMAPNLNMSKFKNGDPIMEVKSSEEWKNALMEWKPAWCNYGYDTQNGKKYGRIYNYFTVMFPRGLAPERWHIPSEEGWQFNCKNEIVGLSLKTPVLLLSRPSKGILITEIYSSSWDKLELKIFYMGMDKCIDTSSRLMLTFRDGKQIALTKLPESCNGEIKAKVTANDDLKSLKTVELKSISVITKNGQVEELLTSEKS